MGGFVTEKTLSFPIGVDDYKEIIDKKCIYIDKTLLIKEFWKDDAKVILVTRPRRFGKTISLSMLRYFFESREESNAYLFEKSKIWQEEGFSEIQGRFPVIFISFKDIKYNTWEKSYAKIKNIIKSEVVRTLSPLLGKCLPEEKIQYDELINFSQIADENRILINFISSLKFITQVYERIYKKKTIVLIDEYDTPITCAYENHFYGDMIEFMRNLLSESLKDNPHMQKGFMTGVVRTAKDGIVSGLNNPKICTMLDSGFADKFGFTEEEVHHLLLLTNRFDQKSNVKKWYNGYVAGTKCLSDPDTSHLAYHVYNPWSILSYLAGPAKRPETYWANTGNRNLLERLISEASEETQNELKLLMEGKSLKNKIIDEDVILLDLDEKGHEPWSFLFFAGYVTASGYTYKNKYFYKLKTPNKEIEELYKKLVLSAINKKFSFLQLSKLHESLVNGDVSRFSDLLTLFVQNFCSSHDLHQSDLERSLHLFVLGLLAALSETYLIDSNLETGKGRCDIMLCPHPSASDGISGIIIEFKKGAKENLEVLAEEALTQIKKLDYHSRFRKCHFKGPVLCYGIASYKKELFVKMELLHIVS